MISEFGGFFDFAIRSVQELFCFLGVAAQAIAILPLSLVEFLIGLLDVMLRFREIRMPMRVNIDDRALRQGKPAAHQGACQYAAQCEILPLHGFISSLRSNYEMWCLRRRQRPSGKIISEHVELWFEKT
jgi:hypothetical protein